MKKAIIYQTTCLANSKEPNAQKPKYQSMKTKILLIIVVLFLISCTTQEEISTNVTSELLSNNRLIEVLKTEKTSTSTGIITHSNYGTTYSFEYQFTVDKNAVIWKNKGSAIPKKIVFCNDTTYVKYLRKKSIAYQKVESDTITRTMYKDTIVTMHEAFIDNRYFFKLFGDSFWTIVDEDKYDARKAKYTEYEIPNDNDFELINIEDFSTE